MPQKKLIKKINIKDRLFKIFLYDYDNRKNYVVEEYKKIFNYFWWQQKITNFTEDKYTGNEKYSTYNLSDIVTTISSKLKR